ncbi:hypothetical protein Agub_g3665, partial [Astrephomene gubernaculifera]
LDEGNLVRHLARFCGPDQAYGGLLTSQATARQRRRAAGHPAQPADAGTQEAAAIQGVQMELRGHATTGQAVHDTRAAPRGQKRNAHEAAPTTTPPPTAPPTRTAAAAAPSAAGQLALPPQARPRFAALTNTAAAAAPSAAAPSGAPPTALTPATTA